MKTPKARISITAFLILLSLFISNFLEDENVISTEYQPKADFNKETAVVTQIIDGDTVALDNGKRVRYIGIDTPEITGGVKQCFSEQAKQKNAELVLGKTVELEKDVSEVDRYDRLLRYVRVDGKLINEIMVKEGFAFAKQYPPDTKLAFVLTAAEIEAKKLKSGLWSQCEIIEVDAPLDVQNNDKFNDESSSTTCKIKGNISDDKKIYHLESCQSFSKTVIDESKGERWFCTEDEAINEGWIKANNC